jgi:hypothetical protein
MMDKIEFEEWALKAIDTNLAPKPWKRITTSSSTETTPLKSSMYEPVSFLLSLIRIDSRMAELRCVEGTGRIDFPTESDEGRSVVGAVGETTETSGTTPSKSDVEMLDVSHSPLERGTQFSDFSS